MKWSQDKFVKALLFAARAHEKQTYPGTGLPYIIHLASTAMEVAAAVSENAEINGDLALQCAVLHDVMEDTETEFDDINAVFGPAVAEGVRALSKKTGINGSDRMHECLERITGQPREIWMVKMADRISNLGTPPPGWDEKKIEEYRRESLMIYDSLKNADAFLASRLRDRISRYPVMMD
ncbi:MAG: HD domain-containing protein [Spirochaetes bacterium]|jgi:(p)ppGpp synthase/HD superfamily hydrolase|nr:HD domain-containing protein [Spirochaetota bacterium]